MPSARSNTSFRKCNWCEEERSLQAILAGHGNTPGCIAKGYTLRAERRGMVRLGSLHGEYEHRVEKWLPVLLRARAPFEVLPTRASRRGNQMSRERGWKPMEQLWVPGWMNLLLATEPREVDDEGERNWSPAFVALLRWAGREKANAAALKMVFDSRKRERAENIYVVRHALFTLFVAANPGKTWDISHPALKRESEDLRDSKE